jgi:hypothetical protein
MFPKVECMFPKVECMFPKVECMFPKVECMFPKVECMFPRYHKAALWSPVLHCAASGRVWLFYAESAFKCLRTQINSRKVAPTSKIMVIKQNKISQHEKKKKKNQVK